MPPGILAPWRVGPFVLRGPVFLCTAMFWIFITGMAALLRLTGVIAALMKVYSPVALALLTVSAIWVLPGLAAFQPEEVQALTAGTDRVPRASPRSRSSRASSRWSD